MDCMKATGSTTTRELKDKADNYRYFLSLRQDIEEQRKHSLGGLAVEDLQTEYAKQQQETTELEKAARAVAQYAVDTYSIRQDIERIESEMSAGAPMDFGGGQELFAEFAAPASAGGHGGFLTELGIASRIGGIETETLIPAVEAAAQRNLSAVTAGRYVRIEIGHEGGPVVHLRDDSKVSFSDLSHGTRDMVYFCLRTGLLEAIAGKHRLPFILDDPLAGFDPARQQAACQILRALGTKTQVILFTSNPALKAGNDAAAELK
jgi:DNA repair exonuclease SbcCD ATPase subunit